MMAPVDLLDTESQAWLDRLAPDSRERDAAVGELHALLLKAARFEVNRRRASLARATATTSPSRAPTTRSSPCCAGSPTSAATAASPRGPTSSRCCEAGVKVRRRAWQGREVQLEPEHWELIPRGGATPQEDLETAELLADLRDAIERDLSPHQRQVLVAVTLQDVPIDVLAERLDTTRGALYKTIHDARRKLRAALAAREMS